MLNNIKNIVNIFEVPLKLQTLLAELFSMYFSINSNKSFNILSITLIKYKIPHKLIIY